jgi:hypothetical protein
LRFPARTPFAPLVPLVNDLPRASLVAKERCRGPRHHDG